MTEQLPPDRAADELSNDPHLPRRSRHVAWATLGAVGVAAAIGGVVALNAGATTNASDSAALAKAAAATSAAPSPSPSASGQNHDGGRRGPAGPGHAGLGGLGRLDGLGGLAGLGSFGRPRGLGGLGPGEVLHGESTVQTKDGKTEIVDTQTGTISAVDTTAKTITVASSDKVSFTYTVDSATRLVDFAASSPMKATLADLKVGDAVAVVATRTGDTRTATGVVDGMPTRGESGPVGTAAPSGQPWTDPGPGNRGPRPSASVSATGASA